MKFQTKIAIQTEAWSGKEILNKPFQSGFYSSETREKPYYWSQADVDFYQKMEALEERVDNIHRLKSQLKDEAVLEAIEELTKEKALV